MASDIYMVNPSGRVVGVPANLVAQFIKAGFKPLANTIEAQHNLEKAKSVSMLRLGGLGDALCLLPAAKLLKYRNPKTFVEIRTSNMWRELFLGEPYIDSLPKENAKTKRHVEHHLEFLNDWNLEVERQATSLGTHPPYRGQMWANHLGLSGVNYAPKLHPSKREIEWAEERWTGASPRIVLCLQASTVTRSPSHKKAQAITRAIKGQGKIISIDPGEDGKYPYTLRQVSALIKTANVIVIPDTGPLHIALGHDTRIVLLPSNTDPKTLLQETRRGIAIEGGCIHWPCYWDRPCLPKNIHPTVELEGPLECALKYSVADVLSAVRSHINNPLKIFAIMLTWNHLDKTRDAIESLRTFHELELLVVDNGSEDGTHAWLKQEGINFIVKPGLGVAEALNVGLTHALKSDAYAVLILNNDVILSKSYIDELVRHMIDLDAGLVVGTQTDDRHHRYYLDKVQRTESYEEFADLVPGDYSATLIRREAIEEVGFFDPNFKPRYIEDNDYTTRLRLAGWSCYRTSSVFFHYLGAVEKSINKGATEFVPQRWKENKAYYKKKWGSDPHKQSQAEPVFKRAFNGKKPDPGMEAMRRALR